MKDVFASALLLALRRPKVTFGHLALWLVFLLSAQQYAGAQVVFATDGTTLTSFDLSNPMMPLSTAAITGIASGQVVAGIDYRPNTGELYALGYNPSSGMARLYILNEQTGAAIAIGASPVSLQPNMGAVNFDFNPTVDRIRVTGSNGANYRMHPTTGLVVATDGTLAYAATDVSAGVTPSIVTGAYTNSFVASASTTLYNFDAATHALTTQIPPNDGTQNTVGPTGLTMGMNSTADMDIFFNAALQMNMALLLVGDPMAQTSTLYNVDLETGSASSITASPIPSFFSHIAFQIDRTVPAQITGQLLYGLTANNLLITFDSDVPSIIRSTAPITGITMGQTLSGLDFRPATGELYGIGYAQISGEARLYSIDVATGNATAIGTENVMLQANMGDVNFDFNPTVDRIRVTGSNGANYRLHPTTGLVVATDGDLTYAAGDANAGAEPAVTAGAYTNSFIASATTTLYNYDAGLNILTTQIPPNDGVLNTIGGTGTTFSQSNRQIDIDIAFDAAAQANRAFLSATPMASSATSLYNLDLTTGMASAIGMIGVSTQVRDIAAFIDRSVPEEITGQLVYGVTGNNNLISFDADAPQIIRTAQPITGVMAGQALASIDFRPATMELYGIGYNNAEGNARLYTIDPMTGIATVLGDSAITLQPGMMPVSLDFNPTVDRIRLIGANGANYRLHPVTAIVVAIDGDLAYAAGDANAGAMPTIGAAAYTNSFAGTTSTTLYNYDYALNVLTTQIPPNDGTQNTVGSTGITVNPAMPSIAMDIVYVEADSSNQAYLSANTGTSVNDQFFTVDLQTGAVASLGNIGFGIPVRSIAIGFPQEGARSFQAQLSGHQEVFPIATKATGSITATLTGNRLAVSGNFSGLSAPVDLNIAGGAHIHTGYAGQNGPVTLLLTPTLTGDSTSGMFTEAMNTFELTAEQLQTLEARRFYVNIHSHVFPSGELRGQLLPAADEHFSANLFGNNEVPAIISNGHGALALELSGDTLVVTGAFSDLDGEFNAAIAGGAHLHLGLQGSNGPVSVLLSATNSEDLKSGVFTAANNTFVLSDIQISALLARRVYANIHTSLHHSGEIRGQVVGTPNALFRTYLTGANEFPFVTTMADGQVIAELKGNELTVSGTFAGLEGAVDTNILGGAHIHLGMAGANGPVVIELVPTLDEDGRGGTFRAADNTVIISDTLARALLERGLYVNIHTVGYPGGEIRGQLLLESQYAFSAYLTGSQSIHTVRTGGHGILSGEISGRRFTASGSFSDLSSAVDVNIAGGSHVHRGLPGSTGPIAFHLHPVLDNDGRGGVYAATENTFMLTDEQRELLIERALYANIHTATNAAGEIRGNFFAEAPAYFLSPMSGASETTPVNVDAEGLLAMEVSRNSVIAVGSFNGLANNFDPSIAEGAHLHVGFAGSNGGISIILDTETDASMRNGDFRAEDNAFNIDSTFLNNLRQRRIYVNVHTVGNPSGEIRGQLMPMAGSYFHTTLAGTNEVQPVSSNGSGSLKMELNGNILTATGSFNNLDGQFAPAIAGGAHIHAGEAGNNGGIALGLETTVGPGATNGTFMAGGNTFLLSPTQMMMLRNGQWYANIHTDIHNSGEVRGQLLADANLFPDMSELTALPAGTTLTIEGAPTDVLDVTWTPAGDPNGDKVVYVWQVATDADFIDVLYMQNTGEEPMAAVTFAELDIFLNALGLAPGETVNVLHRVLSIDGSNATASQAADINLIRGVVTSTLGLSAAPSYPSFSVYPNITSGEPVTLSLESQVQGEGILLVTNNMGQTIAQQKLMINEGVEQHSIDFAGYAPGVYYLSVRTTQGTLPTLKVVKQ